MASTVASVLPADWSLGLREAGRADILVCETRRRGDSRLLSFRRSAPWRGPSCILGMLYFAYIDEFGHVGPYVSRDHPQHKTSPIFGLGGMLLPAAAVREFGEFFLTLKSRLLGREMAVHGITDPLTWEKKGSALYTSRNYREYRRSLTNGTNRLLNHIAKVDGRTVYVGARKMGSPEESDSKQLYRATLELLLRKLDDFAAAEGAEVLVVMDEHQDREILLDQAARMMYADADKLRHLLEPPYQVESHRYQTVQCADWICGLVGRFGAYRASPEEFAEFAWAETAFAPRVDRIAICAGMPLATVLPPATTIAAPVPKA